MNTPPPGGSTGMITVDVTGDPRADAPGGDGVRPRSLWLWVIVVLAALTLGAIVVLWPDPEPVYRPPQLEGLPTQPSMIWQRELDELDQWATVVGETVAIHPSSWRGDELLVELLDPADGEVLWVADYSSYVDWHPVVSVQVRDLPATPYLAVEISRLAQEPYTLLLVERDSGDVAAVHGMAERSAIFSTDAGRFVLLREMGPTFGEETVTQLALLRSHDPDDEVWRVDTGRFFQGSGLVFLERGGLIGMGTEWPGFHSSNLDAVFSVADGSSPSEVENSGPTVFVGDTLVFNAVEGIGALEVDSGEERWQRECRCMPYEVAGELFAVEWGDYGTALMRLNPETGGDLWPSPIEAEIFSRVMPVGEQFVWFSYIDEGTHISGATVSVLDLESGELGAPRGEATDAGLAWDAGDHVVMWDGVHTLSGIPLSNDAEPWEYELPEEADLALDEAAGRLVVVDGRNRTVGALGVE